MVIFCAQLSLHRNRQIKFIGSSPLGNKLLEAREGKFVIFIGTLLERRDQSLILKSNILTRSQISQESLRLGLTDHTGLLNVILLPNLGNSGRGDRVGVLGDKLGCPGERSLVRTSWCVDRYTQKKTKTGNKEKIINKPIFKNIISRHGSLVKIGWSHQILGPQNICPDSRARIY